MTTTLLLIDGHSQFYRALFAPGTSALTGPTGEPTGGTYYYLRMLLATLRDRKPTHVAVAVDGKRSNLERTRIYPGYKANRHKGEVDPTIFMQIGRMQAITKALGLTVVRSDAWEADDILATLARRFRDQVDFTEVVTRDRDLHQLVTNKHHVALYDPQTRELTRAGDVKKHWGVPPKRVVEIKTLMGDPGDAVKGAPGIGPKRALDLIKEYGTAEAVKANADRLPVPMRDRILGFDVSLGRKLVGLNARAPLDPEVTSLKQLRFVGPDMERAKPLFRELGFRRVEAS